MARDAGAVRYERELDCIVIAPLEATWPSTGGAVLVFGQLLLAWMIVQYLVAPPSGAAARRFVLPCGLVTGSAILLLGYDDRSAWALAGVLGLAAVALPALRPWALRRGWSLEWEIGITLLVVVMAGTVVARMNPSGPAVMLVRLQADSAGIGKILILFAAVLFLGKGGNIIVRGFLEKAGTLPTFRADDENVGRAWTGSARAALLQEGVWHIQVQQGGGSMETSSAGPREVDSFEIGRGRLIGTLERTLLLLLALGANYTAVAFLITAKGLVRAKEFERREYAEYFLIGTLASTALALILGTLIRLGFGIRWT